MLINDHHLATEYQSEDDSQKEVVCLLTRSFLSNTSLRLQAGVESSDTNSIADVGFSCHEMYDRSAFKQTYQGLPLLSASGIEFTTTIVGISDFILQLNKKRIKISRVIRKLRHVSSVGYHLISIRKTLQLGIHVNLDQQKVSFTS